MTLIKKLTYLYNTLFVDAFFIKFGFFMKSESLIQMINP